MQFTVQDLASRLSCPLSGDSATVVTGVAGVDTAERGDLVFAESPKFLAAALSSRAAAVLVSPELATAAVHGNLSVERASPPVAPTEEERPVAPTKPLLIVPQPRAAFVQVLEMFAPALELNEGVHESARLDEGVRLGAGVRIAANVTIGRDAVLGDGVALLPGVVVGERCTIGAGTTLHPNVVLYPGVTIGRGCILHAGSVIGADGFGYVPIGFSLKKVPQLGTVEIGDDVEIGANSCVDRAKTGVTRIGAGTKIDNLVHIAHNVTVGQLCLIVAQTGVAGSVTIGNGVVLGGQAGIKDHVALGDGARVGAQGGVIGDVAAGVTVSGYPARPHQEKMRELGALAALPAALKRLRSIEKRLAECEARLTTSAAGAEAVSSKGDPGNAVKPEGAGRTEADTAGLSGDIGPVG